MLETSLNKEITSKDSVDFLNRKETTIAYVLEKFPSPTEYFILNEIVEMQEEFEIIILVIRKQNLPFEIRNVKKIKSNVYYLPETIYYFPISVIFYNPLKFLKKIYFFAKSTYFLKKSQSIKEMLKQFRYFSISYYFAFKLEKVKVSHFHSHFAFIATDVAQILSRKFGVKYSLTAHAQDIYTNSKKLKRITCDTSFLITCTKYNLQYINLITNNQFNDKIFSVYHGIDTSAWIKKNPENHSFSNELKIISVARLTEKKGLNIY